MENPTLLCPHIVSRHRFNVNIIETSQRQVKVCDRCHDTIMLMLASKFAMDLFYRRMMPLVEQNKIKKERAALYARSEVGVAG